jgi:hypothetical protein
MDEPFNPSFENGCKITYFCLIFYKYALIALFFFMLHYRTARKKKYLLFRSGKREDISYFIPM